MSATAWIAIIDDDEAIRRAYTRYFRTQVIDAVAFASADEYVAHINGDRPACIILDVHLSRGMSSFELIDRMTADGTRVPVIFATGEAEIAPEMFERYPDLRNLILKPFDVQVLKARVRRHLPAPIT